MSTFFNYLFFLIWMSGTSALAMSQILFFPSLEIIKKSLNTDQSNITIDNNIFHLNGDVLKFKNQEIIDLQIIESPFFINNQVPHQGYTIEDELGLNVSLRIWFAHYQPVDVDLTLSYYIEHNIMFNPCYRIIRYYDINDTSSYGIVSPENDPLNPQHTNEQFFYALQKAQKCHDTYKFYHDSIRWSISSLDRNQLLKRYGEFRKNIKLLSLSIKDSFHDGENFVLIFKNKPWSIPAFNLIQLLENIKKCGQLSLNHYKMLQNPHVYLCQLILKHPLENAPDIINFQITVLHKF